jgi:3-(3-hydroxy-phenyl)propionate hydroxylase
MGSNRHRARLRSSPLWVTTYRFTRSVATSYTDTHARVLLAGEAAHLFPPFGGARGLNSGIPDAVFSVEAVAQALRETGRRLTKVDTTYRVAAPLVRT